MGSESEGQEVAARASAVSEPANLQEISIWRDKHSSPSMCADMHRFGTSGEKCPELPTAVPFPEFGRLGAPGLPPTRASTGH